MVYFYSNVYLLIINKKKIIKIDLDLLFRTMDMFIYFVIFYSFANIKYNEEWGESDEVQYLCFLFLPFYQSNGSFLKWRVWRYKRGNQKPSREGQTKQLPNEKRQKNNGIQNITQKIKDRITRTPQNNRGWTKMIWKC
jgi:hypothetical protein